MFERFTDRARRAVVLAQEEARVLNHSYIGTTHLLLGLIAEGEGVASQVLAAADINPADIRAGLVDPGPAPAHIPFTPRVKKVLEQSLREALSLGHSYIGTEHLLLAIAHNGEGGAVRYLETHDVPPDRLRILVIEKLASYERYERSVEPVERLVVTLDRDDARKIEAWFEAFDHTFGPPSTRCGS